MKCEPTKEQEQFRGRLLKGDMDTVTAMVRDGFDLNAEICDGRAALHLAIECISDGHCEKLLSLGSDVNLQFQLMDGHDDKTFSPLHYAAQRRNLRIYQLLLEAGANPSSKAMYDVTPAHVHLEKIDNHIEWLPSLRLMLEHGADPNAVARRFISQQRQLDYQRVAADNWGSYHLTPLHNALFIGQMIEQNISVAARNGGYDSKSIVRTLLDFGAEPSFMPEKPVSDYLTPLQLAAKIGTGDVFRELMDSPKAIPGQKTVAGRSLKQLTGRPEIRTVLHAHETTKTILDSIEVEPTKEGRKPKGMSPL